MPLIPIFADDIIPCAISTPPSSRAILLHAGIRAVSFQAILGGVGYFLKAPMFPGRRSCNILSYGAERSPASEDKIAENY